MELNETSAEVVTISAEETGGGAEADSPAADDDEHGDAGDRAGSRR